MEISTISDYSSTKGETGNTATKTLSTDDFLKLFTMQLQYQDPLEPMDSSEFTAQLAQFSSLEQLSNINTQMNDLLLYQNSLQNTLATSLIGKEVKVSGDEVYLKDTAEISYSLSKDASKVKISIYDSSGKLIQEVDKGQQTSGDKSYVWDGKDTNGNAVPKGQYKFKVEATDASGNSVDVDTMIYGTVTGITFDNNTTYLVIDGDTKVQFGDIKEINSGGV